MPNIDLILDADCPNVEAAREALRQALLVVNSNISWREWDRASMSTPEQMKGYGSPTILVDGTDVAGVSDESRAASCRVYCQSDGKLLGVPAVETIVAALQRGM